MNENDVKARVAGLLSAVLNVEVTPEGDLSRENFPQWDSLKHISVIFSIEKDFGINIKEEDFPRAESQKGIVELVTEYEA